MDKKNRPFSAVSQWHRHSAMQLYWPSNQTNWPEKRLNRAEEIYSKIIEELHFFEPIHLFVEDLEMRNRVMQKLAGRAVDLDRVFIHQQNIRDAGIRRFVPLFVLDKNEYVILDWDHRDESRVHDNRKKDPTLAQYISDKFGMKRVEPGIKLEGVSIDVNGAGTLLATESILHKSNRDPDVSKKEAEEKLLFYLGADQVIWLKNGLNDRNTYKYIEGVARWLNEDTVVTMVSEDPSSENYDVLQKNLETLRSVTLKGDKKLNIETLPFLEKEIQDSTDLGLKYITTNYIHFYIANGAIVVPVYNENSDEIALNLFKRYFTGRKIIRIEYPDLALREGLNDRIIQPWYGVKN